MLYTSNDVYLHQPVRSRPQVYYPGCLVLSNNTPLLPPHNKQQCQLLSSQMHLIETFPPKAVLEFRFRYFYCCLHQVVRHSHYFRFHSFQCSSVTTTSLNLQLARRFIALYKRPNRGGGGLRFFFFCTLP